MEYRKGTELQEVKELIVVSPDGVDNLTAPTVKTLQFAVDNIISGGVIVVHGDFKTPYDSVIIRKDDVNIIGTGGAIVVPRGASQDGISIVYASGVTIDSMGVINAPRHGFHATQADGLQLSNCSARDCGEQGIFTSYSDSIILKQCGAYGTKHQHGVYLSDGGNNGYIQGLTVSRCARAGLQINADRQHQPIKNYNTMKDWYIADVAIIDCGIDGTAASVNLAGLQHSILKNIQITNAGAGGLSMWNDDVVTATGWGCNDCTLENISIQGKRGLSIIRDSRNVTVKNLTVTCDKGPCIAIDATSWGFQLLGTNSLTHLDPTQKIYAINGKLSDTYTP